jgi:hypothetical protein
MWRAGPRSTTGDHDIVVRVGLDLRRPQPPAVLDRGPRDPSEREDRAHDPDQHFEPYEDVLDRVHRLRAVALVLLAVEWAAEEEDRVVRHFRMLRQIGRQRRVKRQIVGPRQQRWVEPEDLRDRRRILFEDLAQPFARVARRPLVHDRRRLNLRWSAFRGTRLGRLRLAGAGGWRQPGQQDHRQ